MASVFEISLIVILIVVIIILGWRLYVNGYWYTQNKGKSLYRSASAVADTSTDNPLGFSNVTQGGDLKLDAPSGYSIYISNIYVNGMPAAGSGDYDPNSNPNYTPSNCWKAISNMGPGFPASGDQKKDSTYVNALKNLKSKYDGKSSATIPANDSNLLSIVDKYLTNSKLSNYSDMSSYDLTHCDVSFTSQGGGSSVWAPLVVCLYECKP